MRSPFWKTYLALALLAAMAAWVYFGDPESDLSRSEKLYPGLKPEAVRALSLAGGEETIHLERDGEGWRLSEPHSVAADTTAVADLLAAVGRLAVDETLAGTGARPADFGLDPPRRALRLLGAGGAELALFELGGEVAGGGSVYARAPGRPDVFTVGSGIASALQKRAFDFRDRDLLHVERDAIVGLGVSGPEGDYALARTGGEWAFTAPLRTPAGRWSVDGLVGLIAGLRMEAVAAEDAESLAEFGLDPPQRRLAVNAGESGSRLLEIGSATEDGRFHARDAARRLVAVIPPALVEDLLKGMPELRSRRVAEVSSFDVVGLSALLDGQERVWERSTRKGDDGFDEHTWKRSAPDPADVETSSLEDVLYKLGGLEAESFIDAPEADSAYGLDAPFAVIRVRRENQPELELRFGRRDAARFARRPGDDAVLALAATAVDELLEALKPL